MTDRSIEITADDLVRFLGDKEELALLDVREVATIRDEGTLLRATSLTLGELELRIATLVPRLGTRIVLLDGAGAPDGIAHIFAARLSVFGYSRVQVLAGGTAAWAQAGQKLFPSPYVIGQSFGEFVENAYDTPRINASELHRRLSDGEDVLILDSRTPEEFRAHSLPGGISCPGAELALRVPELAQNPQTTIVVNCAGRTRSIMGAQILRNAGLENPVFALEDGTMGWRLAGFDLDHGARQHLPDAHADLPEGAKTRGDRIAQAFSVPTIDAGEFAQLLGERSERTLFALDVRTPAEFAAGHHPAARSLPSWLAAPWISFHAATQNARVVLLDSEDTVRAAATASWLYQLGWQDVSIFPGPWSDAIPGVVDPAPIVAVPEIPQIDGAYLEDLLAHDGAILLDAGRSEAFRKHHIEGSFWAPRSYFPQIAGEIPGEGLIVLTSHDDRLAAFAAQDLQRITGRPVALLRGGLARWIAEGRSVAAGEAGLLVPQVDVFLSPWRDGENGFAAFREYLQWEKALVEEIKEDPTIIFKSFNQ